MLNEISNTIKLLGAKQSLSDKVLIGFSGGKDSLCILDMAIKLWGKENIILFYMYLVKGLNCIDSEINYYLDFFGIDKNKQFFEVPHFLVYRYYKYAIYRIDSIEYNQKIEDVTIKDVIEQVLKRTQQPFVLWGAKRDDSLWARQFYTRYYKQQENVDAKWIMPIFKWSKFHVMSYLQQNKIRVPKQLAEKSSNVSGAGLDDKSLFYFYDNLREDYEKIQEEFPLVEALIKRREFYGH